MASRAQLGLAVLVADVQHCCKHVAVLARHQSRAVTTALQHCNGDFNVVARPETCQKHQYAQSLLRFEIIIGIKCEQRACSLKREFLLVQSMSSRSHLPRLYATHARCGSLHGQQQCD